MALGVAQQHEGERLVDSDEWEPIGQIPRGICCDVIATFGLQARWHT
jgi:hypothetical protein